MAIILSNCWEKWYASCLFNSIITSVGILSTLTWANISLLTDALDQASSLFWSLKSLLYWILIKNIFVFLFIEGRWLSAQKSDRIWGSGDLDEWEGSKSLSQQLCRFCLWISRGAGQPATQFNLYNNHYSRISFKILVFLNYCYIFVSLLFFPLPRDHQKEKEMSIGLYGALRGRQPFQILCKAKSSLTMSVASRNTWLLHDFWK